MGRFTRITRNVKRILNVLFVIVIAFFIADIIYINHFNSKVHTVQGNAGSQDTYISVGARGDSTSSWIKRDYDLYGETVDLNANTYDANIINKAGYEISTWTFKMQVKEDCFINQAWCGTVEIHQHAGTANEKVQTLDLQNYDMDSITLDYLYQGDLLINLYAGDYIIYYPSEEDREVPVEAYYSNLKVGFIMYYLEEPDLTDYSISFKYHRGYSNCSLFWAGLALGVLWLFILDAYIIAITSYKAAEREMKLKTAGVSSMSDIYSIIYIIDLKKNELLPVTADKDSEKLRPSEKTAQEQLRNLFMWDSKEEYRDAVVDFCNLDTIRDRLGSRNTIVCEYISRHYGWCQLRFFAMDRGDRGELEKLIFTIQVINDEKTELETLNAAIREKTENIVDIQQKIVVGLANIIENRDDNTGGHVKRTSDVISILVEEIQNRGQMNLDGNLAADIVRAAPMHDLGKISIDSSVLCKPGRLTDEEFAIMKTHAAKSGEMVKILLEGIEEEHFVKTAFNIARHHHERWDGHGYPDGLQGADIPVEARIMAVADVYDALVSKRCYKEPMSFDKAYSIMMEGMGTQFDPGMKDIFEACHRKLEEYYSKNN